MEFKPYQKKSKLESIYKFTNCIKFMLKKARATIYKSQKNITRYYNQRYIPTLIFYSGNNVFLDLLNIHTMHPPAKLSHYCFEPSMVEKQVRPILYCLKLLSTLQKLYLVFPVVKLTTIPNNSISGKYSCSSLDPVCYNLGLRVKVKSRILNWFITRELNRVFSTKLSILYILLNSLCYYCI